MRTLKIFAVCAALCGAGAAVAGGGTIRGEARILDADTIRVAGLKLRLDGVDAAEAGTRLGDAATGWMRSNYGGEVLTCRLTGAKTYDRWVATCWGPGGEDIGAALIAAGGALDCARYSGGRYAHLERNTGQRRARYC